MTRPERFAIAAFAGTLLIAGVVLLVVSHRTGNFVLVLCGLGLIAITLIYALLAAMIGGGEWLIRKSRGRRQP